MYRRRFFFVNHIDLATARGIIKSRKRKRRCKRTKKENVEKPVNELKKEDVEKPCKRTKKENV